MLLPCNVTSYIFSESNGLYTPNAGRAWIKLALEHNSDVIGVVNIWFFGSHQMVTFPFYGDPENIYYIFVEVLYC